MKETIVAEENPFPSRSVISIAGALGIRLRTLVTQPFTVAAQHALDYLNDGIGQVISVAGPFGSGKTHLVNYTMRAVEEAASEKGIEARYKALYAKAERPDFPSIYVQLINQIGLPLLKEVNDRFIGVIALREMKAEIDKSREALLQLIPEDQRAAVEGRLAAQEQAILKNFRRTPEIVYKYLDNLVIQPETVFDEQASQVREFSAGDDFKKAFYYLTSVDLQRAAYNWFVMGELTDTEMRQLGVSSRLSSADDAKYALRLLVTLFKHVGIRLFVYIDQVERLLLDADPRTFAENSGLLQSLAEFFPREKGFLMLSGADDGWAVMRKDFWGRIGSARIEIGQISRSKAKALIRVYQQRQDHTLSENEPSESEIAPFTSEAIDQLLRISGGNIRRFLQSCYDAYARFLRLKLTEIDFDLINEIAGHAIPDRTEVAQEIQNILRKRGLNFQGETDFEGFQPNFIIGELANPAALVEISDALFVVDEVETALSIARLSKHLLNAYPHTRLLIVVVGYASPRVLKHLRQVGNECLVYEREEFKKAFEGWLDSLTIQVGHSEAERVAAVSSAVGSLQSLLEQREKEVLELNERLTSVLSAKPPDPDYVLKHNEWRSWLRQDQERYEQRRQAFAQQADEERRRLQAEGERLRNRRILWRSLPFAIACLPVFVISYLFWPDPRETPSFVLSQIRMITIWVDVMILTGIGLIYYVSVYKRLVPLGTLTSEIAKFSGDLGQLNLRARTANVPPGQAWRCIDNPNPLLRYFGAQVFLTQFRAEDSEASVWDRRPVSYWIDRATPEGWRPLYLAYFRLVLRRSEREAVQNSDRDDQKAIQDHFHLLLEANPEDSRSLYALSLLGNSNLPRLTFTSRFIGQNPRAYGKVVAHALFEHAIERSAATYGMSRQHPLVRLALAWLEPDEPHAMAELARWYEDRGQFWHPELTSPVRLSLSEDDLQMIISALSPHYENGLASFDDLPNANLYLRLYRFFAEIQWRFDHGDVVLKP